MKKIKLISLLFGLSVFSGCQTSFAAPVLIGGPEGAQFNAPLILKEVATPANPASNFHKLYFNSADGRLYQLNSSGVETEVGPDISGKLDDPMTIDGDMIYRASGVPAALAIGSSDTVLISSGSTPGWAKILNANIDSAAAIGYGKLNLAGSVVNSDIGPAAAIAYGKLDLLGNIVNADVNASAGIVDTKLATISSSGKVANSATTATSTNTNSAIVARDGSGNFGAGTITASLTGNVSGNVTGSVTGNSSTATALAANPTDCGSNTYATTIDANGNLTCASITNASTTGTSSSTNSTLVLRDGSSNFSAGTITAALTGNASTATALAANPSDCSSNQFATTIAANGNLTCAQPNFTDLAGFATGVQGGTNNNALAFTAGGMFYSDGSKFVNLGVGTEGQVPISHGVSAPGWGTPQAGLISDRELITNTSLDIDASGYTAYADAAGISPVDGTGGSPSSTCAWTSSSPITGAGSLLITKSGTANRQGEGCAVVSKTLSAADTQPTMEDVEFDYTIPSGTFTAGSDYPGSLSDSDYEVYLYDTTNATIVSTLWPKKLYSNVGGHFRGTFQTVVNATTYRLILHNASTTTNNFTLKVDNISMHPSKIGGSVTLDYDPIAYTPTISSAFGTVTGVSLFHEKKGANLHVYGTFNVVAQNAVLASISLPANLTLDVNRISLNNTTSNPGMMVGSYENSEAQANTRGVMVTAPATSTSLVYWGKSEINATSALTPGLGTEVTASTVVMAVDFWVPISGWTGGGSSSGSGQVVSWNGIQTSQGVTANVTDIAFTTVKDSSGAWNGTQYTVPAPGDYLVSGNLKASTLSTMQVYLNTTVYNGTSYFGVSSSGQYGSGIILVTGRKAGDILSIRSNTNATITDSSISIFKISSGGSCPQAMRRIAILRDEKTSGTSPQVVSTSYAARQLNTITDPTGIVSNSASFTGTAGTNTTITLDAGTYYIDGYAPGMSGGFGGSGMFKVRLQNTTDSTTPCIGESAFPWDGTANTVVTNSHLKCIVTISGQKTFEFQQRSGSSSGANNGGRTVSFGDNEVYSTLTIEKVN